MAIRRPSISSQNWTFQDFSYVLDGEKDYRYTQVKWDGERYTRTSQTFDYSDPPFTGVEQKGGNIVCQINYVIENKLVTIEDWDLNWRDDWPLRLAINYLIQCKYLASLNYLVRVVKNPANALWVSEQFFPVTNDDSEPYLYYTPG